MEGKHSILFFLILICFPPHSYSQAWSGIIAPSRAVNWSNAGVTAGIPSRTTNCATLGLAGQSSSYVQRVTGSQINNAIANCAANGVVFLNAGTYNISDQAITFAFKNNVTLRGAGADRTILNMGTNVIGGNASCGLYAEICISSDRGDRDHIENSTTLTGTKEGGPGSYPVGATHLTFAGVSGLALGGDINIDQADDTSDGWPSTGDIYVCSSTACTGQGGGNNTRPSRGQLQMAQVTNIAGTTVTISPGLTMPNWRSSRTPGVWWPNTIIHDDGVEDLTVNSAAGNQCSTCGIIVIFNARNCWVKGVRSISPNSSGASPVATHIWLNQVLNSTIRDSYFYGSDNSSQSYGIEFFIASFNLIENNIFQHVTAPTVEQGPGTGNVVGYNFAIDDNYTAGGTSPGWMDPMHTFHEAGEAMELYEGNQGLGFQGDNIHGTHHFGTFFRNYFYGDVWNNPHKNANTDLMHLWRYNRFFNFVGNVLGRSGYYNNYQQGNATSIFNVLGGPDASCQSNCVNDTRVAITLMRWGNYDTVTGAVRWCGNSLDTGWATICGSTSEVPTGITNYSNPVPRLGDTGAGQGTMPPSFYYSSKPAFFAASKPWPPIGPDVSGGNVANVGGHVYTIPAQDCWTSVMGGIVGTSGLLSFNESKCYYGQQQQQVNPPSNLVALPK